VLLRVTELEIAAMMAMRPILPVLMTALLVAACAARHATSVADAGAQAPEHPGIECRALGVSFVDGQRTHFATPAGYYHTLGSAAAGALRATAVEAPMIGDAGNDHELQGRRVVETIVTDEATAKAATTPPADDVSAYAKQPTSSEAQPEQ
jgi:hypothetical protein